MNASIASAAVHANGQRRESIESAIGEVFAPCHTPNNVGEGDELHVLAAQERVSLEERDHFLKEILSPAHDEHEGSIVAATVVLPYRSTSQSVLDEVQDLLPTHVLIDPELWHQLPAELCARVPLDRYMKAAFSIDEARYVRVQSFLLIGRTCRFVTVAKDHGPRAYGSGVMTTSSCRRVAQDSYGYSSI